MSTSKSLHIITFETVNLFNIHKDIQGFYNTRLTSEIENMEKNLITEEIGKLSTMNREKYIRNVLDRLLDKIIDEKKYVNNEKIYKHHNNSIKDNIIKLQKSICEAKPNDDKLFIEYLFLLIKGNAIQEYETERYSPFDYNEIKLVETNLECQIEKEVDAFIKWKKQYKDPVYNIPFKQIIKLNLSQTQICKESFFEENFLAVLENKLCGLIKYEKLDPTIIIFDFNADIIIIDNIYRIWLHTKDSLESNGIIKFIDDKITKIKLLNAELNSNKTSGIRELIKKNPRLTFMVSKNKCLYLPYYWDFIWQKLFNNRQSDNFDIKAIIHSISELQYLMMEYLESIFNIN